MICSNWLWFLKKWMVYFSLSTTYSSTTLIFCPYLQLILVTFFSKLIGLAATNHRWAICRSSDCTLDAPEFIGAIAIFYILTKQICIPYIHSFVALFFACGSEINQIGHNSIIYWIAFVVRVIPLIHCHCGICILQVRFHIKMEVADNYERKTTRMG